VTDRRAPHHRGHGAADGAAETDAENRSRARNPQLPDTHVRRQPAAGVMCTAEWSTIAGSRTIAASARVTGLLRVFVPGNAASAEARHAGEYDNLADAQAYQQSLASLSAPSDPWSPALVNRSVPHFAS